jgi:hypothetical protein
VYFINYKTKIINKMKKITNYSTIIEYKIVSGKPLLILKRKQGNELTSPCPFCGTGHYHGTGDGHRISHCADGSKKFVIAPDGTMLYENDGYVLVTI